MMDVSKLHLPVRNKALFAGMLMGVFLISGVFGFLYESTFYLINNGVLTRRGTCFGPWIQLYAYGGLLLIACCWWARKKPWLVFLLSAGICGVLEFATGWALFYFGKGFRSWDYNTEIWNWGNIGGFICLRSVLFFGISGLILIYLVWPLLNWFAEKVTLKTFLLVIGIPTGIFLLDAFYNDIIVSFTGWPGALIFYRDSGWYGIVAGLKQGQ